MLTPGLLERLGRPSFLSSTPVIEAFEANTKRTMSGLELPPGAVVLTLKELESSLGVLFVGMSTTHSQLVGTNSVV